MAWLVPYNKLDDDQKDFVDNAHYNNSNFWIKGFPGSGKSVLLAHTIDKILARNNQADIIVVVFTQSLVEMFRAAFAEMNIHVPVITYFNFMDNEQQYDYILCDEVQDLPEQVLSAMHRRSNHLVVSGDENQSIYEKVPSYNVSPIAPNRIPQIIKGETKDLKIIHRLSSTIIGALQSFLPRMNIFSAKRDMTKQSTQVRICYADSEEDEVAYIMKETRKALAVGQTVAILMPIHNMVIKFANMALENANEIAWEVEKNRYDKPNYNRLNSYLHQHDFPLKYVGNSYGEFSEDSSCATLMTFHSSKGLDFDNVFIPFVNSDYYISPNINLNKTLFMVAMTRSRNNLYLTYTGLPYRYLSPFMNDLTNSRKINIHDSLNAQNNNSSSSTNVFGI